MAEEILYVYQVLFFFFQAEDGIRDLGGRGIIRSEEHTSELQSRSDLVCRLLLEKKKHTSELQSRSDLVCRLLLEKQKRIRFRSAGKGRPSPRSGRSSCRQAGRPVLNR